MDQKQHHALQKAHEAYNEAYNVRRDTTIGDLQKSFDGGPRTPKNRTPTSGSSENSIMQWVFPSAPFRSSASSSDGMLWEDQLIDDYKQRAMEGKTQDEEAREERDRQDKARFQSTLIPLAEKQRQLKARQQSDELGLASASTSKSMPTHRSIIEAKNEPKFQALMRNNSNTEQPHTHMDNLREKAKHISPMKFASSKSLTSRPLAESSSPKKKIFGFGLPSFMSNSSSHNLTDLRKSELTPIRMESAKAAQVLGISMNNRASHTRTKTSDGLFSPTDDAFLVAESGLARSASMPHEKANVQRHNVQMNAENEPVAQHDAVNTNLTLNYYDDELPPTPPSKDTRPQVASAKPKPRQKLTVAATEEEKYRAKAQEQQTKQQERLAKEKAYFMNHPAFRAKTPPHPAPKMTPVEERKFVSAQQEYLKQHAIIQEGPYTRDGSHAPDYISPTTTYTPAVRRNVATPVRAPETDLMSDDSLTPTPKQTPFSKGRHEDMHLGPKSTGTLRSSMLPKPLNAVGAPVVVVEPTKASKHKSVSAPFAYHPGNPFKIPDDDLEYQDGDDAAFMRAPIMLDISSGSTTIHEKDEERHQLLPSPVLASRDSPNRSDASTTEKARAHNHYGELQAEGPMSPPGIIHMAGTVFGAIATKTENRLDKLLGENKTNFEKVGKQFKRVDVRFDRLEKRMDAMNARMSELAASERKTQELLMALLKSKEGVPDLAEHPAYKG